jgi:hypothetical protein
VWREVKAFSRVLLQKALILFDGKAALRREGCPLKGRRLLFDGKAAL